ncbi:right-handed parallel beta-helix repeat-containing protein [Membranicola marinus]|uniref:Right-handed parallel beta-helix repeat-containing protein n=1 Tax=Membranihabitans marinus TaxID=1227546 RepID=A0A953HWP6_9BACT|nr:right-handed parallel beta-helix repeat-containing protein [Membranihabitans marinus]MBY5957961.1 right-handed parallel beta-helix repeat-containing protein [Membranihabitans marinus]
MNVTPLIIAQSAHKVSIIFSIAFLFVLILTAGSATAQATWNVTSSADAGANTLREAIDDSADGDIININVSSEIMIESGLYVFLKDLTIHGNGATINSVNSSNYTFFFDISNTTINDLTMKNLSKSWPVITAINSGPITLNNCTIIDNPTSSVKGGAIHSNVPIVLNNCTIQNNTAQDGGGIYMDFNALTLLNSIISGNTATGSFGTGGISCTGPFKMTNSEIINNNAPSGWTGGLQVYSSAIVEISGSKINNNSGNSGAGGCSIFGALALTNSEIVNNTCNGTGGGIQFISFGGTTPSIIMNSTISQNTANHSGGISYAGTSLTINDSHIDNNHSTQFSGGGLFISSGELTLKNSTVNNNEAKSTGGGIYSNVDCIIDNSKMNGNTSNDKGGGIYMYAGKLELKNQSEVNDNTTSIDGGGIYLNNSASTQLIANNSSINSNKTIHWGGGGIHIRPNGHTKILTNCELKNNRANTQGGAIYNQGGLQLNGVTMTGNKAQWGGGLYVWSGQAEINNSSLDINEASSDGGGVYSRSKLIIENNSTINENTAGQTGGGLWISHTGQTSTISGSQVNGNEAQRAAGILIGDGALTIDQGSQVNSNTNVSNFDGAGIYNSNAALTIKSSSVNDNTTAANGAGVFIAHGSHASLTTDQADITGNTAGKNGGGVYLSTIGNIQNSTITQNTATGPGGGIYVRELAGAKLSVTGGSISDNTASYGGGLILYHNNNANTISNCDVKNNEVTQQGGGAWIKANTSITGSTFESNSAVAAGGGIFMDSGTSTVKSSTLSMNSAAQGAGLYVRTGDLEIQSTNIEFNESLNAGGGIHQKEGTLSISDQSSISNNESINTSGGGIYVDNGKLTLNDSEVKNNKVKNGGGGIYLNSNPNVQFSAENSSISGNTTQVYGGGGLLIKANNHKKIIRNCIIQENTAKGEGGGLVNNGELEILDNSIIKNNESQTGNGGGLYNTGALMFNHTKVLENHARRGGGLFTKTGNATIESSSVIQGNEAIHFGGGVFFHSGTHVIRNSAVLDNQSNNSGGGIFFNEGSLTIESAKVNDNSSTGSKGGGIHNEKGALIIKKSEINGNSALTWGGGIYSSYLTGAVSFSIDGSEVNGNSANNGGGISVDVINNYTISNTEFKNNTAQNNGGAINIIGGTGMVDISQVTIVNNQATHGGGISNTSLDLMVHNSTINHNQSTHHGGGIYNENNNTTLTNSKINGNTSNSNGGGIWNNGTLDISDSEIRGNTALYWGGGILTFGTATLDKMIIEGNSANDGGGIANVASISIDYSTITNNTATNGGGLHNLSSGAYQGNLTLTNSIVSLNHGTSGADIHNTASISGDHNLLSDYTGSGLTANGTNNLTGDPLFVSDFNNLNLTKCSPAIDAASNGDDMGALQSGLTAIVPVITTASITVALNDQHPNLISIDPSMVSYNFMGCTDITISLAPVDFDCSHVGQSVTTTATVTYSGGQSFQQPISVIVLDQAAPHFTPFPPDTVYVAAGDPLPAPDPVTYADNCGGVVALNVSDGSSTTLKCGEKIYRTYSITDVHGNVRAFVQTIIIGDGIGPEITVWDEDQMDITGLNSLPVYSVQHDTTYTSFTSDAVLARYCGQSQYIQRTYTALDACHNESTKTLNIMFSDEEKPVLTKEADFLQNVENGDTIDWVDCIYPAPSRNDISWSDNSGKAVVKTHVYPLPLPDTAPFGLFKLLNYVYEVEDECGNSTELNFYMGLYDLQGPIFQYIPRDTIIQAIPDLPPIPNQVIILDVCNYVVWDTVATAPIIDPWTGDTTAFSRKWMARDVVGHETFEEQIIYIKSDKIAYGEVTARIAYHDKLTPKHFDGEIGENGIEIHLYRLNTDGGKNVVTDSTTTQNWFGRNGSGWMTGILPGSYQVKVDVPEGFYIRQNSRVDSLGWSDTLTYNGELIDLGLIVFTPILEPKVQNVQPLRSMAQNKIPAQNQEWMVYPNPSHGQVKIEYSNNEQYDFDLFDRTGKRVRSGRTTNGSIISLDELINGVYVLQLRNGDEIIGHKKLVLMR